MKRIALFMLGCISIAATPLLAIAYGGGGCSMSSGADVILLFTVVGAFLFMLRKS